MKRLASLAIVSIAAAWTPPAYAGADEIRACKFEVKARCASGEARVTLADGVVKRLEVDGFWCGQPGNPGYLCSIDWSRSDGSSLWSDDKGATVIANAAPARPSPPDRVKVTVGRYVSIDFAEAQSGEHCGAGAELPKAIVIPGKTGQCRVWLGD